MLRTSFTSAAVCVGLLGLLAAQAGAEEVKAPLNGIKPFQTASAQSDVLKVEAGPKTVAATDAWKIQGHPNSRITVVTVEGTGDVHVADVILRDGDSVYKVIGNYRGGGGGGGGGGWWARYERGPNRLGLYVNTVSSNDNYVGLGGPTVKTATVTVYVANTTPTANGYAVTLADQAGGGEVGFPNSHTCTLGKIGGADYETRDLSGKTHGATIIEATATGLAKGETDAFVTSVAFTDKDGAIKGEYYIGDDDIFVTVWDGTKNTDAGTKQKFNVTVADQTSGGSGDTVALEVEETDNDTGIFRNKADGDGYGLKNDNLMDAGDPGITGAGAVDVNDQMLKTEYGRSVTVLYGTQTVTGAILLRENSWPFNGARTVAQNFGVHEHVSGPEAHHTGIDIPGAKNTAVYFIQNGVITHAGDNYVIVKSVCKIGTQSMHYLLYHMKDGIGYTPGTSRARVYAPDGSTRNRAGRVVGAGPGGGTFDHCHVVVGQGAVLTTTWQLARFVNPLKYAFGDCDPKSGNGLSVGPAFFRKDGLTGVGDYLTANGLSGKIDISAEVTDDMGGDIASPAGLNGDGLKQGQRCIPFKVEYSVYANDGTTIVKAWQTAWTFDKYWAATTADSILKAVVFYDQNKLVPFNMPAGNMQQGYVQIVTHVGIDERLSLDTRGLANGSYKVKVRATDLAGNADTRSIDVTIKNLILVEDKAVNAVTDVEQVTVTALDATGNPRQGIKLVIDSYDNTIIEQVQWVGGTDTTNAQGKAFMTVKGKADGVTNLVIKEDQSANSGTGVITVGGYDITVPNVTVYAGVTGDTKAITAVVKDKAGAAKQGVKLVKDFLNEQIATMTFPGSDTSDASGQVTVNVTGVAPGTTELRLKADGSSSTGTGTVTVKGMVLSVQDKVIWANEPHSLVTVTLKDSGGAAISGATVSVVSIDGTKATAAIEGSSTTAADGTVTVKVTPVTPRVFGATVLKMRAQTSDGASQVGQGTITIDPKPAKPTVTGITPNEGTNTAALNITNLAGTNFAAGAVVKLKKAGQNDITATNVTVESATKITCTVDLTGKAVGGWTVRVTNVVGGVSSEESTDNVTFTVKPAKPTVTGITPNTGPNTAALNITDLAGTNFVAGAVVKLKKDGQNDITATNVTVESATKITCTVDLTGKAVGGWTVRVTNVVGGVSSDESTDNVTLTVTDGS